MLRAIGLPAELMEGALRIGVGKFTSDEEVLAAAEAICQAVEGVRAAVNS